MIQRKQTLFLLVALILTIVGMCLPVATFTPQGMGTNVEVYNLWVKGNQASLDFSVAPLFVLLLLSCPLNILAIFMYKNRILQARLCLTCMLLLLLYCVAYGYYCFMGGIDAVSTMNYHMGWATCCPPISFILYAMARQGVLADEKLVRSMDRIR